MIILGIETSCDETALCLLETKGEGLNLEYKILGNIVHSQIELHREYGGVYPTLAKREHIKNLPILFEKIKKDSGVKDADIDAIAVTAGPGLEPALWTGITFAEEFGKLMKLPIYPINHMEGHTVSTLLYDAKPHKEFKKLKNINFVALALLISGGHTEIVSVNNIGEYKILGRTKDDALGEAFDKVARMLGLPYPGGPEISLLAKSARKDSLPKNISLPRPMISSGDLNLSFSGLKTSVLYTIKKLGEIDEQTKKEIAREFEDSVTEVLSSKIRKALEKNEYKSLIIGGGVVANEYIRESLEKLASEFNIPVYTPVQGLSGDNALMIALAGAIQSSKTKNPQRLFASGNLSLENL